LSSVSGSPVATGTHPISAVSTNGYVYVANQGSGNVSVFSIAADGTPTQITSSPFSVTSAPTFITVDSSGKFLLEADQTRTISEFPIDSSSGALSASSQSATLNSSPAAIFSAK
jgi:6-phosphogluconolactonase (cycloisomerase 2 family)